MLSELKKKDDHVKAMKQAAYIMKNMMDKTDKNEL
jgi:hypothetical protein